MRGIVLDPGTRDLAPVTELLLYFADRAQHVAEVIRPALDAGPLVLCDRHVESSLAYQGYGRGLPLEAIRALGVLATGGLRPDAIVLLDVPVEIGLARARRRGAQDRLEAEELAFHERVRGATRRSRHRSRSAGCASTGGTGGRVFESVWRGLVGRGLIRRRPREARRVRGHERVRAVLARALSAPPAAGAAARRSGRRRQEALALAVAQAALCEEAPGPSRAASAARAGASRPRPARRLAELRQEADRHPDEDLWRNFRLHPDLVLAEGWWLTRRGARAASRRSASTRCASWCGRSRARRSRRVGGCS